MKNNNRFHIILVLVLGLVSVPANAAIVTWSFTADVYGVNSAPFSLPFTVAYGDSVQGSISLDYSDPGEIYIAPFIRKYSNQPNNNILASINGVPVVIPSTTSFRHDAEVWNDSGFHDGADLFFMSRQTIADPRYSSGYEVSMTISGGDSSGLTISSLALPTTLNATDFGGLTFGLGIIDLTNPSPNFQLAARITSLTLVPAAVPIPAAFWLFGSGLVGLFGFMRRR